MLNDALDCLIIRQPFASLIVFGVKRWEFRSYASDKRGTIAIAASKAPPLRTSDAKLNQAAINRFPRGVVLGTARVMGSHLITSKELQTRFRCCQQVTIHGLEFLVASEPLGEPPDDIRMALSRKGWRSFVWELDNVKPLAAPIEYLPAHGSTWTKVKLANESGLMSFMHL